jgi:hypothetical protein
MNANELADMLLEDSYGFGSAVLKQAATMLRTIPALQAEIEALKKLVHQRFDDGKRLGIIETEDRLRKAQEK